MTEPSASKLPQAESPATPSLGIGHLLLWIACSSLLLTASIAIDRMIEAKLSVSLAEQRYVDCIRAIIEGPAVAALLIWMARRRRGMRFPVQPGEWLLVVVGLTAVSFRAAMSIWNLLPTDQANNLFLVPMGLVAAGYLFVALWPPLPKWWRVAMLTMCALWAIELTQSLVYSNFFPSLPDTWYDLTAHIYFCSLIGPIIALIVCGWIDRTKQIRRGWLHWTGVAVCLASLLLAIAQHVYLHWLRT